MDLRAFDLNLLLAFEALANTGSVSKAADRLGIRQPAMSAALARLRNLTGDRLFERMAGRMEPTPRAIQLAAGIESALAQIRMTLAEQIDFDPTSASRTFTIASTDYTSAILLPPLSARLQDRAPRIDLRVIGYEKQDIAELVARGDIDLALGVFDPPPPDAVRTQLWRERFVGLARNGHPLLADLRPETYAAANHALVSVRRDARGRIDHDLAARGLHRRIALVVPHMLALLPVLAASDLVAAIPERMARHCAQWHLEAFTLPIATQPWQVEMLWRPSARLDQASRWLRSTICAVAKEIDRPA
jgi:DNA-binding transcriptional LysR family regulator